MKHARRWRVRVSLLGTAAVVAGGIGVLARPYVGDPLPWLEKGQRPWRARERLEEMARERPEDLTIQSWLLRLELEGGDLTAAERRIAMLKIKAPHKYVTLAGECSLALKKGWKEKAVDVCEEALFLSRRGVEDLSRLATALLQARRNEEAMALLEEARRRYPADPRALNNLGYGYLSQNNYSAAFPLFQEALKRDPALVSARKNLARLWFETQRYEKSVEELKTVLRFAPDDPEAIYNLAAIFAKYLNQPRQAAYWAKKALLREKDPRRIQTLQTILQGLPPKADRRRSSAK